MGNQEFETYPLHQIESLESEIQHSLSIDNKTKARIIGVVSSDLRTHKLGEIKFKYLEKWPQITSTARTCIIWKKREKIWVSTTHVLIMATMHKNH